MSSCAGSSGTGTRDMTSATTSGFIGRYNPSTEALTEADRQATLRRLRWLANFLDTAVRLPGGFRFGADTIIGLAPGVGDLATAAIACYFVYEGKRLACRVGRWLPWPAMSFSTWR